MAALRARATQRVDEVPQRFAIHAHPGPRCPEDLPERQPEVAALDGVSIEVGADESVGLVGESGSGKTTLSRILRRPETGDSGQITIDGIAGE